MRSCIIPGSFDPPTNGHIDLINRASCLFDQIIVLVANNSSKTSLFTPNEREMMLKEIFKGNAKVLVEKCDGLVAMFARQRQINILVRGIRNAADYSYETEIYQVNKTIWPQLDTIFIPASTNLSSIRSSSVRELALYNLDVSLFVPEIVNKYILQSRKKNKN